MAQSRSYNYLHYERALLVLSFDSLNSQCNFSLNSDSSVFFLMINAVGKCKKKYCFLTNNHILNLETLLFFKIGLIGFVNSPLKRFFSSNTSPLSRTSLAFSSILNY